MIMNEWTSFDLSFNGRIIRVANNSPLSLPFDRHGHIFIYMTCHISCHMGDPARRI